VAVRTGFVTTETIRVSGIRCERCVGRLASVLTGHDGLESASATLMGEARTTREQLLEAMARGGFHELPAASPAE